MSFSSEVKAQISKINNLANKQAVKYELLGYFASNRINIQKDKVKFSTENEYNINRFSKLISNLQYTDYQIEMIGKNFCITLKKPELPEVTYQNKQIILNQEMLENQMLHDENLKKAFIRGCFLAGGAISNPKNTYHMEITLASIQNQNMVLKILEEYQISLKTLSKKNSYSLYTKDGDEISKFLALVGANSSVLQFEEVRVYRDMRNQINRKVNCETANLNKTVSASYRQTEDILYLQKIGELKNLSDALQEIAKLRLENPDASLTELGEMLKNPIGKSGVNHRFETIQKIAEELRKKQGEELKQNARNSK